MASRTRIPASLTAVRTLALDRSLAQLGIVRRCELLAWGVTDSDIRSLLRRGIWTPIRFGVYADAERLAAATPSTRLVMHTVGALLGSVEPAIAFGPSAAALHTLSLPRNLDSVPWLLRPTATDTRSLHRDNARRISRPDLRVVTHDLSRITTVEINEIPSVDTLHAAVSSAALTHLEWSVAILDSALWHRPDLEPHVTTVVEEWPFLKGIGQVRKAARLARSGAQTPLESISRVALMRLHLPEPQLQVPFHDEEGLIGYADMYWDEFTVIGESDGAAKYETREDLIGEKRREDRLRRCGFTVVRWMWSDIMNAPERVAAEIRAAGTRSRRGVGAAS